MGITLNMIDTRILIYLQSAFLTPLNLTRRAFKHSLELLTTTRHELCLPLRRLCGYYFSRHGPTQTRASVECLPFNDRDRPPWSDSPWSLLAFPTRHDSFTAGVLRLGSLLTSRTAAALRLRHKLLPPLILPSSSLQPLWLSIWNTFFHLRTHRHRRGIVSSLSQPQSKRTLEHILSLKS